MALSSIGYLKTSLFHNQDNSKANSDDLDKGAGEKRKKVADFEMFSRVFFR